ncbi:MAG: 1-acyl-sn-glycerol-3-phosphate acyltransferase [Actinomycetota bacterium]|nr:1-acyl-sn-glycerol-3-phosphate acyltransferase [Actinomycetota bacterium]
MAEVISLRDARRGAEPERCQALTASGNRCRNRAVGETGFCRVHLPQRHERIGPFEATTVQSTLEFLRRRLTGDYEVDEYGFDQELTERVLAPLMRPLDRQYWRIDWRGLENIPDQGAALLVANHSGTVPVDSVVMKFGVYEHHPMHRHVRLLAADLAFRMPFVGPLARKMGNTLASPEDSLRLLEDGELVGVFPEGYKGVGKGFRERYRLQRFGRGGFIELALKARVPLIPVAIVGAEEIYPMIGNAKLIARLGGFPYFPITPLFPWFGPLGAIPLPSKWIVEFGEPIHTEDYDEDAWQDAMLVFELTDRIRDHIQQMLYRNLMSRRSAFF